MFFPGHVVPPEKVHTKLFVGSQTKFKKPKHPAITRYNQKRTADQIEKMTERLVRKERKLRKRLAAHGIDYDFPGFVRLLSLDNDACCTEHVFVINSRVLFVPAGCTGASEEKGLGCYV